MLKHSSQKNAVVGLFYPLISKQHTSSQPGSAAQGAQGKPTLQKTRSLGCCSVPNTIIRKPQTTETAGETSEPGQTDAPVEILELQVSPISSAGHSSPLPSALGWSIFPPPAAQAMARGAAGCEMSPSHRVAEHCTSLSAASL